MRWLTIFTLLLFASIAVPVLAEPTEEELAPLAPSGQPVEGLPNGMQVAEGLKETDLKLAKEEEARETTAAAEERDESLQAFADASPAEAMDLVKSEFAAQLEMIEQDPARLLSDASIEQVLSPTSARVKADGETMLVEGTMPVRVPTEGGDLGKVDLSLVPTDDGFTQANPVAEVELPESADEGVAIGEDGLAVEPVLTEGESTAHRLDDKDVFYPETQTDTDLLAMPTTNGVELFSQLRSIESPEDLRFDLSLPEGSELRADGEGGAEIVREGETLATVPAPTAFDAQGAEVPVEMSVEGAALLLNVPHRDMEVAYPLLVDPAIAEDWATYGTTSWYSGNGLAGLEPGIWAFSSNNYGRWKWATIPINTAWGGANRGLYISANSTAETQWAYQNGQWSYTVPGQSTYIAAAGVDPFWRENHTNCSDLNKYPEPHDYVGLWSPSYGWTYFQKDAAQAYKHAYAKATEAWSEYVSQIFIIGLGNGVYNTTPNPCSRDIYAGGAYVWMSDGENPSLTQVKGGPPSGWFSDEKNFTITATASDAGLGVQYATLFPEGNGYIERPPKQSQCTGLRESPCPASREIPIEVNADYFDEGKHWAELSVADAIGKVSPTYKWETWVDRTPPEVILEGQFAKVTHETGNEDPKLWEDLSLPTYNLKIKAEDGSKKEPKTMRSGVKNIEVFLDGKKQTVPWEPLASCPESSCPMEKTYQVVTTGLIPGKHTLKVIAIDFVGKKRERDIEFEYMPATGMKEEFVLQHFPLLDGQGKETPDRPELAVNVMNGNLVFRQQDVKVTGASANLEVERYYNSQLPSADNTQWGDGWTLAQTPDLEPIDTGGSPAPDSAKVLDSSGTREDGVKLPEEAGKTSFDPTLHATITKEAGGYLLKDETGSSAGEIAFDESGRAEELRTGNYSKVDYGYEGGALKTIAVKDAATASAPPAVKAPTYASAFGTLGSGNGQLKAPGDVVLDASGNLWVIDKGNNRVEKFNSKGEYLLKFGTLGSGNGQLNRPTALAIDAKGNVWVADSDNNRIQEFNSSGAYVAKFGTAGTGNGQFAAPEGIAIAPEGNIWVADTHNGRLQKFTGSGSFLKVFSSKGSGAGQLGEPKSIEAAASGAVWVTDWQYNRVAEFAPGGKFMRQFGTAGTGNGQFEHPAAIGIDSAGSLWVADQGNGRIQRFDEGGAYQTKFGAKGSGSGQFSLASPTGIVVDGAGNVWATDPANNRVQKWAQPPAVEEDDPSASLKVEGGLVRSLEGAQTGSRTYAYSGDDLTSYTSPQGTTTYKYDASGRMTEVKLPNATYATIAYDSIGRVEKVVVAPGGTGAKTSYFEYVAEPRRTKVVPAGRPAMTYDIAEDGSVLKWWNTVKAPEFDDLAGSLYAERGEVHPEPIAAGDRNLVLQAHSAEGIASIEIIANGTTLVHELKCKYEKIIECPTLKDEWVTNTSSHAPGILYLEAVATDRLEHTFAQRFWVNIPPPPPPPPPGAIVPPTFEDVLHFREEFGLDVWEPVEDELDLNDRIWNVLGAWHNPETPEGQVARASWEKWGIPMRNVDVAEMEYREAYVVYNGHLINEWATSRYPGTYGGYYIDNRAGGIMHVGFTQEQSTRLSELKQQLPLIAVDRLEAYPTAPVKAIADLTKVAAEVNAVWSSNVTLKSLITEAGVDEKTNTVYVGTTNVSQAQSILSQTIGQQAPITVIYQPESLAPQASRFRTDGRILAGDNILNVHAECTAGFGAYEDRTDLFTGAPIRARFLLTAGHCFSLEAYVHRSAYTDGSHMEQWTGVGEVTRSAYGTNGQDFETDGEAIRLESDGLAPYGIHGHGDSVLSIGDPQTVHGGDVVCFSGARTNEVKCKEVLGVRAVPMGSVPFLTVAYLVKFDVEEGDSGAPVWSPKSKGAVGLVSGGRKHVTAVAPLIHPEGGLVSEAPGILNAPGMAPLHLITNN